MSNHVLNHKNHQLSYYKYGQGENVLIAFHGFGQNGRTFEPLANAHGDTHTVYSFDLFYHGDSYWGEPDQVLRKDEWAEILKQFLQEHQIDRFEMAAFSLGGKFALTTLEQFTDKIDRLILIAPDGIETQMWYDLATYPLIFQRYFKSMIVKPKRFFNLLKVAKKLGIVDRGILKFAGTQMSSIKKRRRVYYSWVTFKNLRFRLKELAISINRHNIETIIFTGKYDKIITSNGMKNFTRYINQAEIHELNCGHNDLIDYVAEFYNQIH